MRDLFFCLSYYFKFVIERYIFGDLKRFGLFIYRGKCGGGWKIRWYVNVIFVLVIKSWVERYMLISCGCNYNNLIRIKCF